MGVLPTPHQDKTTQEAFSALRHPDIMVDDFEMCNNCKRDIPIANYQMHTAHCARNITLCSVCNEPVPRKQLQSHEEVCSAQVPDLETRSMSPKSIQTESTPAAICSPNGPGLACCQFCQLEFPGTQLSEHENYCGSRTEQCPECFDYVMLKDWDKHQSMRLYHELAKKPCHEVFGRDDFGWSSSRMNNITSDTDRLAIAASNLVFGGARNKDFNTSSVSMKTKSQPLSRKSSFTDGRILPQADQQIKTTNLAESLFRPPVRKEKDTAFSGRRRVSEPNPEVNGNSATLSSAPSPSHRKKSIVDKYLNKCKSPSDTMKTVNPPIPRESHQHHDHDQYPSLMDLIDLWPKVEQPLAPPPQPKPSKEHLHDLEAAAIIATLPTATDNQSFRLNLDRDIRNPSTFSSASSPSMVDKYLKKKPQKVPLPPPLIPTSSSYSGPESRDLFSTSASQDPSSAFGSSAHDPSLDFGLSSRDLLSDWRSTPRDTSKTNGAVSRDPSLAFGSSSHDQPSDLRSTSRDPLRKKGAAPRGKSSMFGSASRDQSLDFKPPSRDPSRSNGAASHDSSLTFGSVSRDQSSDVRATPRDPPKKNGAAYHDSSLDFGSSSRDLSSDLRSMPRDPSKNNGAAPLDPAIFYGSASLDPYPIYGSTSRDHCTIGEPASSDFSLAFGSTSRDPTKTNGSRDLFSTLGSTSRDPSTTSYRSAACDLPSDYGSASRDSSAMNGSMFHVPNSAKGSVYRDPSLASGSASRNPLKTLVPKRSGAATKTSISRGGPNAEDQVNRERLREMLCNLRKDPMSEDLEANDGSFFPCEFCGDPYPVEFLMRHQLSCDLNPSPIASGQGFDYDQIAQRAAANIQLAKSVDQAFTHSGMNFQ